MAAVVVKVEGQAVVRAVAARAVAKAAAVRAVVVARAAAVRAVAKVAVAARVVETVEAPAAVMAGAAKVAAREAVAQAAVTVVAVKVAAAKPKPAALLRPERRAPSPLADPAIRDTTADSAVTRRRPAPISLRPRRPTRSTEAGREPIPVPGLGERSLATAA
ncbi:MAG: hypothetical protein MI920_11500 [Kiloniellales bacterium]|nr:hypothetical protein [Kiloniellales bacterium]